MTREQRSKAEKMLYDKQWAFNLPGEPLPLTPLIQHDIELQDPSKVIFVRPRFTPIHQRPPIEHELQGLLDHDLAVPTTSPHSSPVVLVRKKKPGTYRLAVDFRTANLHTIPMYFPVHNIEEIVMAVSKGKIHSSLDLRTGFMQIGLTVRAMPITGFSCHQGH